MPENPSVILVKELTRNLLNQCGRIKDTAKFYIEKLVLTGNRREPSSIEFGDGLNFIDGLSNNRKSLISDNIDYIVGFDPSINEPFRFDTSFGYDVFTLHARTPNGTVIFQRKYGATKISISGTDPNFELREYCTNYAAKYYISSICLQMIGIDEPHKILQSQAGKRSSLL